MNALEILDWAARQIESGNDAVWVYKTALAKIHQLGLSMFEEMHYERRLSRITHVNE